MSPHAIDRLEALNASGVEVGLLCAKHWWEGGQRIAASDVKASFPLFPTSTALTGKGAYYFFVPDVGRVIKRFSPDLVLVREEMYTVFAGQFLAERRTRFSDVPFVFESWQNIRKSYPWPSSWFESIAYRSAAGAIAGTPSVKKVLELGGFGGPCEVIPLGGIDLRRYGPDGPGMRDRFRGAEIIGYVGRLVAEKAVHLIFDAVRQAQSTPLVVIAGDGPQRQSLEARARSLGIDAKFIGAVEHSMIPRLLRSLDALVLPSITTSRWKEQWGRVMTEAMACGTPVIGSTSGEIPYVLGDAGMIFEEGDVNALAAAIDEILQDPGKRAEFVDRGLKRAAEFSWDRHAERTEAFLRRLSA